MAKKGGGKNKGGFDQTETVTARDTLGPNCDARALGHDQGFYYFSDPIGQLRVYDERKMTPNGLISLFLGDVSWLNRECPTDSKRGRKQDNVTWHNPTAVQKLIWACKRAGPFNPAKQTRGPGIWPIGAIAKVGKKFEGIEPLVIHVGDQVGLVLYTPDGGHSIDWQAAGVKIGGFVYPAAQPQARPSDTQASDAEAQEAYDYFARWKLQDGDVAAMLALGGVGLSYMPAVFGHRPSVFLQGGSGSGKSALLSYCSHLVLDRVLMPSNSTWAFLRDEIKKTGQTIAIYINEAEVSEDNSRMRDQINLATYCYTRGEGSIGRSGSGGGETQLQVNFFFAAVEPPPLRPQDANRMAFLRLDPLTATDAETDAFEEEMLDLAGRLGPLLARRAIVQWPRFMPIFRAFRTGLRKRKHDIRGANTLATLLAMGWILRHLENPMSDEIEIWCNQLNARLISSRNDVRTTEGSCLFHLNTYSVQPFKTHDPQPLGEWIRRALHAKDPGDALRVIRRYGVSIVRRLDENGKRVRWVAVSNKHQGLEQIFRGTSWAKGSWVSAIRMLPGAIIPRSAVWFSGSQDRATLVPEKCFPDTPLDIFNDREEELDEREDDEDADEEAGVDHAIT